MAKENKSFTARSLSTPEARENQMVCMAMDLAEKQLREGTASSQVITHFLKIASTKDRLEKEIMKQQKELMAAKTQAINDGRSNEALYQEAIDAMRRYQGN